MRCYVNADKDLCWVYGLDFATGQPCSRQRLPQWLQHKPGDRKIPTFDNSDVKQTTPTWTRAQLALELRTKCQDPRVSLRLKKSARFIDELFDCGDDARKQVDELNNGLKGLSTLHTDTLIWMLNKNVSPEDLTLMLNVNQLNMQNGRVHNLINQANILRSLIWQTKQSEAASSQNNLQHSSHDSNNSHLYSRLKQSGIQVNRAVAKLEELGYKPQLAGQPHCTAVTQNDFDMRQTVRTTCDWKQVSCLQQTCSYTLVIIFMGCDNNFDVFMSQIMKYSCAAALVMTTVLFSTKN